MSCPVAEIIEKDIANGRFILKNNTNEFFSDNYCLEWFVELSGYVIDKGILEIEAEPMGEKIFGFTHDLPQKGLCTVLFSVVGKRDTEYGAKDSEFAFAQFVLQENDEETELAEGSLPMKAEQTESLFVVHSPIYAVAISKKNFLPLTMVCDGKEILAAPAYWKTEAPVTVYRPTMKNGTALARFKGLWVESEIENPLSAGSIEWVVNGEGKLLLHLIPVDENRPVSVTFPLLAEFDYMDMFAKFPYSSTDGAQKGVLLSRESGSTHNGEQELQEMRELSVSSGEVTLSVKPEHPVFCKIDKGLTLTFNRENKVLFSLETEHM